MATGTILLLGDHMDSWKDMDVYLGALFLFFVDAPLPPGGGSNGGGGVVCGQGTHEKDGQCVPDPVSCPQFIAEQVLLDGVTAEARCVEVSP